MRIVCAFVSVLAGCTVLEYESNGFCCKAELDAGTQIAVDARVAPVSESLFGSSYPQLTAEFVLPALEGANLVLVDAELSEAGTSDSAVVEAGYFDVYTRDRFPHVVASGECCAGLAYRIPMRASSAQLYGPLYFGVRLTKTYRRAHLPEHALLTLRARTASGHAEVKRDLKLVRKKSEGVPFRFH